MTLDVSEEAIGATTTPEDLSATLKWKHRLAPGRDGEPGEMKTSVLRMPTLGQLLGSTFRERKHLLFPWLREQESCMVYADTGVGKSLFALSVAIAVAGGGEFLGWRSETRANGEGWRVLYIDGEMHIADIQERVAMLLGAVPGIDREKVLENCRLLARQHQDPEADFPLITDPSGMKFVMDRVRAGKLDLIILDNFSTLGEVEDENAASSFTAIQQFLLGLKTAGVATMLVHHAGKSGDFRGSSKLAATFETIIKLERTDKAEPHGEAQFRVVWDKVRAGGPKRSVQPVFAKLLTLPPDDFGEEETTIWEYEAAELTRLEDIRERLSKGEFMFFKEIGDLYGVSKVMAGRYVEKAKRLGLWSEEQERMWLAKGKRFRTEGKTEAPTSMALWGDEEEPETEDASGALTGTDDF